MSKDAVEPIPPEDRQNLIAGYVLYDLDAEEAATFEEMLANDPAIAEEINQVQRVFETVHASQEVSPPNHLKASILQAYQTAQQAETAPQPATANSQPIPFPTRSTVRDRRGWRRRWTLGLGAAAAAVIVGLGINNYTLRRSLQTLQTQQPSEQAFMVALEPTENTESSASATVDINPDKLEATLTTANLPPLAEGQVYALWTVLQPNAPFTTDEKDAILTDVIESEAANGKLGPTPLPGVYRDRQWIKAIAITVEDAAAPQLHQSSPILFATL